MIIFIKNFQPKIQQILEYLQNISNPVSSKVMILKYIENLFDKINFNAEIFLKKSKKLNWTDYTIKLIFLILKIKD